MVRTLLEVLTEINSVHSWINITRTPYFLIKIAPVAFLAHAASSIFLKKGSWNIVERNQIDVRVGERVQRRRDKLAMTESDLAMAVGITVEELRLHETGDLHVDAELLLKFKNALNVEVSYFFSEHESNGSGT